MSDFILELYSEEIPAGMQARAMTDLTNHIIGFLASFDVEPSNVQSHSAPQRIALSMDGLPENLPDRHEQKKGPRLDAPEKAIEGFLRANGLDSTDALSVEEHPKGAFYVLEVNQKGQPLQQALATFLPEMIAAFAWPKSMRWGAGSLRWVRPLRAILCCLDGAIVPFEVDGIVSGKLTYGHRFMAPQPITIERSSDYLAALEKAYVLADPAIRQAMIAEVSTQLAQQVGGDLVEDAGLINETAGLVEWPVPLLGKIDAEFMDVPEEVLISVMRTHQKYFALRGQDGKLMPYFITVSNMQTADQGAKIIAGNERVLRARLSDGRFFWDQDRKQSLESRLPDLEKVTFQARLGTVRQKSDRLVQMAQTLAVPFAADVAHAQNAAHLCKADLVSGMVYEFPELQGIMGGYYANHDGLDAAVGAAIRDHYKPLGPGDALPATAEGQLVALADKIDTLTGFWSIDEKPTGSKDPYALRRAALGVIRILQEGQVRLSLKHVFAQALALHGSDNIDTLSDDLMNFVGDRLKVYLRDRGLSHDIVSAVFADGGDDLVVLISRAEKLAAFLASDDGGNLLAAYRRAQGICAKAEKLNGDIQSKLLVESSEQELHQAINSLDTADFTDLAAYDDYLNGLATLRAPVDGFFDAVMVNDDNADIRQNRLNLLQALLDKMRQAAAFELIE